MGEAALVTPRASAAVRADGVAKRYGRQVALAGVDLDVRPGELHGLIGADGAGKSSLLRAVAGVLVHDAGTLDVLGVRIDSERAAERVKGRIGFLPQGLGQNLYPELTVEENVDFFARLRLVPERDLSRRKERLLGMTRLAPFRARAMKHLSGGMKQKLGLVCTLVHAPELLVLDEPTTGVDPVSRRDFWAILAELLRAGGLTALVATAYLDEASRFDRVTLLHEGRVLAEGDPLELARRAPGAAAEPELEDAFLALVGAPPGAPSPPPASFAPRRALAADEAAVDARALTRDFGPFRAVDAATFTVRQGEIFGLLGANGAGKTTLVKMLTGLLRPSSGEARVAGVDMARRPPRAVKRHIGYVSQAFSLYTDLTVAENLFLYAGVYGLSRGDAAVRADEVVAMAGLVGQEDAMTGSLPMGVRQRLALGCALLHRPRVLFLDEPTSGVDPVGRRRFWELLLHLARREGVAVLVTTHYMSEAERCDRLALLFGGRVVANAPPAALKREVEAEAGRILEISAEAPADAADRLRAAGFADPVLFGRRVHVLSRAPELDAGRVRAALDAAGIGCRGVREVPLSMEDVFVHRVRRLEAAAAAGGRP